MLSFLAYESSIKSAMLPSASVAIITINYRYYQTISVKFAHLGAKSHNTECFCQKGVISDIFHPITWVLILMLSIDLMPYISANTLAIITCTYVYTCMYMYVHIQVNNQFKKHTIAIKKKNWCGNQFSRNTVSLVKDNVFASKFINATGYILLL